MKVSSLLCIISICTLLFTACQNNRWRGASLAIIDSLSDTNIDSASQRLSQVSSVQSSFTGEEEALYNLLQTKISLILKKDIASDSVIDAAIGYYERTKNDRKLGYAYYYKAWINFSSRADSLAILYALKAIDKATVNNDFQLSVDAHNLSGNIYLNQNLPQYAQQAFEKAYRLTGNITRESYYKPLITRNIARAWHLKKMLSTKDEKQYTDTAISYYNKALDMLPDSTPNSIARSIYRELSTIYLFRKEYAKSFRYMEAGKDTTDMMLYYSKKADLFMNMEKYDSTRIYLEQCLSDQRFYVKYTTYDKLYRIERIRQNTHKALNYADTLFTLTDTMMAITIPDKIVDIQKKYEEEKLRSEKANLEVKYEKEKTRSLRISFIIAILLFLSTYIYIYNHLKKKKMKQSLLEQKNELLLQNQQTEHYQKKIHRLEGEKKQIESNLDILAKDKETILLEKDEELKQYQEKECEISIQKSKYEELCFMEFKKLFLLSSLASRIPAFGKDKAATEKLSVRSQEQLIDIMDEVCFNFAYRLRPLLQGSTKKTCVCCLIKLQVKPRYIMILCDLSKEVYYKQCQRIAENLLGNSSILALKDFLNTF